MKRPRLADFVARGRVMAGDMPAARRYAAVMVIDAAGTGLFLPFEALYGHSVIGLSFAAVGVSLTGASLAGLAVLPLAGRAIDRFGALGIQIAAMAGATAAFLVLSAANT